MHSSAQPASLQPDLNHVTLHFPQKFLSASDYWQPLMQLLVQPLMQPLMRPLMQYMVVYQCIAAAGEATAFFINGSQLGPIQVKQNACHMQCNNCATTRTSLPPPSHCQVAWPSGTCLPFLAFICLCACLPICSSCCLALLSHKETYSQLVFVQQVLHHALLTPCLCSGPFNPLSASPPISALYPPPCPLSYSPVPVCRLVSVQSVSATCQVFHSAQSFRYAWLGLD